MILGLIGAVVLASGSLLKAIAMIVLGLLMGLVGTDVNSGVARFSFDIPELTDGIGFVVVAIGVFGYGEIITNLAQPEGDPSVVPRKTAGNMCLKSSMVGNKPFTSAVKISRSPSCCAKLVMISP